MTRRAYITVVAATVGFLTVAWLATGQRSARKAAHKKRAKQVTSKIANSALSPEAAHKTSAKQVTSKIANSALSPEAAHEKIVKLAQQVTEEVVKRTSNRCGFLGTLRPFSHYDCEGKVRYIIPKVNEYDTFRSSLFPATSELAVPMRSSDPGDGTGSTDSVANELPVSLLNKTAPAWDDSHYGELFREELAKLHRNCNSGEIDPRKNNRARAVQELMKKYNAPDDISSTNSTGFVSPTSATGIPDTPLQNTGAALDR